MLVSRPNLTHDYGLTANGVCFDPITGTLAAISAFAAANAGAISAGSAVVGLLGSGLSAAGTLAAGNNAKASANNQAAQMDQQATQARAASQRTMMSHQRQTELTQSTLQARAAASGAGAQDDTVVKLGSDIAGRGEEQALMDLYNGENTARGLEDSAKAKRASGSAAKTGSYLSAGGTLLSGIGQGFSRFAQLPSAPQPVTTG